MYIIDKEIFDKNLLITQAYCAKQLADNKDMHVAGILRSFNPEINGKPLFSYKGYKDFTVEWSDDPILNNESLYDDLFIKQLANKYQLLSEPDVDKTYEGKILVAEIDQVIRDGASEIEADGFIDYHDCPPVDTWFYMIRHNGSRVLFAWIPERFVQLIKKAIEVNMLDTFRWYDNDSSRTYYKNESI
jgi:hypothetical protein